MALLTKVALAATKFDNFDLVTFAVGLDFGAYATAIDVWSADVYCFAIAY